MTYPFNQSPDGTNNSQNMPENVNPFGADASDPPHGYSATPTPFYQAPTPPQAQPQQYVQPQSYAQAQPQHMSFAAPTPAVGIQQKSMVIAAILAFFLGSFGVHNFYLGYNGRAVAQLCLTVVGWITAIFLVGFLLLFVVGIWVLADLIMILTRSGSCKFDSRGVPLQ